MSKSLIIDSDVLKAYELTNDFFINLGYIQRNSVKPKLLFFKKRESISTSSDNKQKDFAIRVKISFNPVGNLQLYSTTLITIRCEYSISVIGNDLISSDRKYFEAEFNKLKKKLSGKIPSKSKLQQEVQTCTRSETNLCKEVCENLQIQITFKLQKNEIRVGEEEKIEIKVKNVGKNVIYVKDIKNILTNEFKALRTSDGQLENNNLNFDRKKFSPNETKDITVVFEPLKKGSFEIKPEISYFDDFGSEMSIECHTKVYKVLAPALPGRIPSGYGCLDNLLFGGIPEKYAVILTSPSIDERETLINNFLTKGIDLEETTFYVTFDSEIATKLATKHSNKFYLFLTNPKSNSDIKDSPNVFTINGVGTLSNISIALTKAFRLIDIKSNKPKRICIDILSDVLLQHKAVVTRKWISGLVSDLKSKGFTIIGVLNDLMHPQDQVHAILGIFDGEIKIYEKESKEGIENILRIKRLYNKKYSREELKLT